ncbi:LysR family transcriptional regulator [Marinomonas transparens]|uniref:LysR family transcriptional regulator n=1 Tax=Marinomonas transparens TaxID=2795388 RepID=A0A934JSY4_9GAMM|nr:LysR family transcriptional regulator [Marinomonas transparens]MBJ7536719.1 LysR family transcriptional regulator [Marinomonas transparens]
MTLEQLKMLKAVIQEGSLQGASNRLFKTQPAISKGLQQLESGLGIAILDRSGYKLKLTQQGELIYQKALMLLEQSDQLSQMAKHYKTGSEAKVVIAVDAMFDLEKLVPIFEHIQNEFPQTQVILKQEFVTGGIDSVVNNKAQLAISAAEASFLNTFKLVTQHIYTQSIINVAAPKMLARHKDLVESSQLRDEYQIIVQDTGNLTKGVELDVQQGQRKWYVNDYHSKRTLCLSGIGWGRLPYFMVKEDIEMGRLVPISLNDTKTEIEVKSYVMKPKGQVLGPVANKLWDQISLLEH